MDVATFCAQSRVLVVAGKGGVGKTTVSAAVARAASRAGLSVLVVELEGKSGLPEAFGSSGPLPYEAVVLNGSGPGRLEARRITPDDALLEYLADHGLQRISKRLVSSGVLEVVATAIPGLRDVLVLGKVKQLERSRAADLVVVDAPATGHAVTFLTSARGLLDSARGGPLRAQAAEVAEMLADPARCRVLLVTLPEELPVSETVEAAFQLEDRAGVQLAGVVVNGWDEPDPALATPAAEAAAAAGVELPAGAAAALDGARRFRLDRQAVQAAQLERLERDLPLPRIHLPLLSGSAIGPPEVEELARALATGLERLGAGTPT
jgi:anion-transporting  ArsA/GET3 family ATPase